MLKGLSGDSGNPATLTMIHAQQGPEHVMEAAAAVSGSNGFLVTGKDQTSSLCCVDQDQ